MIRINLLPFRAARKKENVRKQLSIYALTVILLLLVMAYLHMSLNSRLAELDSKEKTLTAELAKYAETNKQLKEIQAKIDELRAKLDVIHKLEKAKTGPVLMLEEVARAVPNDRLWLRIITENEGILRIEGSAMDNDTVALFMTQLEKADHISSVDLVNTKMRHIEQYRLNVTDFDISCKTYSFKEPEDDQQGKKPKKARR
jgi:type IV pilus assembly protein PilN